MTRIQESFMQSDGAAGKGRELGIFDFRIWIFDCGAVRRWSWSRAGGGAGPAMGYGVSRRVISRTQMLRKATGLPWSWRWMGSLAGWAL